MRRTERDGRGGRLSVGLLLVVVLLLASPGFEIVFGVGDSMEPRYQPCDLVLVDTVRDTPSRVDVHDAIAYRSGSGLIVHEVVGVAVDEGYVWAQGANRGARDRVTAEMLVGVVVTHLETSALCSLPG